MTNPSASTTDENERLADEIAKASPEGRPAYPGLGPKGIWAMLAGAALLIVVAGLIVAIVENRSLGLTATVIGLVLFVANPVFWASILRAKERGDVLKDRPS